MQYNYECVNVVIKSLNNQLYVIGFNFNYKQISPSKCRIKLLIYLDFIN